VLHAPSPDVAQLENRHEVFAAAYDQVSGTERYVDGEYLYTDHLYDDFGSDTAGTGGGPRAEAAGKLTYPTDLDRFGANAADLVELRVSTRGSGLAIRLSLNTLLDADVPIAVLAFDADRDVTTGSPTLPADPGAPFPGTDHVLTVRGTEASWGTWADSSWSQTPLEVGSDLEANQITTVVPASLIDPRGTWRVTAAVGLHDGAGGWLRPGPTATATRPGGAGLAGSAPSGIFNLAFRFEEPVSSENTPPDEAQAAALRAGEPTRFGHDLDFDLLRRGAERTTVPTTGTMVRFFPSRVELGEGRIHRSRGGAGLLPASVKVGRLQPYSVFVPEAPAVGHPLTLYLHSLNQYHWQYNGSAGIEQVGARRGNVVLTPDARGSDGWYHGIAEYDVFEAWNDLAQWIDLDPGRTTIAGYSMGGYGAYRLGGLYPDLFARALTVVGPPGDGIWIPGGPPTGGYPTLTNGWLENTRNLPFLNVAATPDEIVPYLGPVQQNIGPAGANGLQSFDALGYRFRFVTLPAADHLLLGILGYDLPFAAEFLGDHRVERDPRRVTYSAAPSTDAPDLGLVHDGAYWVSDIRLADPSAGTPVPKATVDATSHGFGQADPASIRTSGAGTDPLPYHEIGRAWDPAPHVPPTNRLDLNLANVRSTTIDVDRAHLSLTAHLRIHSSSTHGATVALRSRATTRLVQVPPGSASLELAPPVADLVNEDQVAGHEAGLPGERGVRPSPAGSPAPATTLPATGRSHPGLLVSAVAVLTASAARRMLRHHSVSS
jgi:hypothetical protein